jgi:hypothetical protein
MLRRTHEDKIVQSYAESFFRELCQIADHEVIHTGPEGVDLDALDLKEWDFLIDLDCGRDRRGNLTFVASSDRHASKVPINSAVWFVDSHGHPDLHRRLAPKYDHVFYAVWDKRSLFEKHSSAHFLPNATDDTWFSSHWKGAFPPVEKKFDFGFFGSKNGLSRADDMVEICKKHGWTYDVRQVNRQTKHRWPATSEAMEKCRFLFNKGQKHDINLRIFESMAMGIPLICDLDERSGIDRLFKPWVHFIPYTSKETLEDVMDICMSGFDALNIADSAEKEVTEKHLVKHRVEEILEVCLD